MIEESPLILLTRSNGCPNCKSVKSVLLSLGVNFQEVDVDENPFRAAPFLKAATSRSLPLMFHKGENVASGLSCIGEARKYAH